MNNTVQRHMVRRSVAFVAALVLALTIGLALSACSTNANEQNENTEASAESIGTAHFVFDTNAIEGGELIEKYFEIKEGDTPIDMLDYAELTYELQESDYGSYVYSVDGTAQGDHGSMSGWLYYVNNEFADEAADKYEVKDGDTISWIYSTGEEYA